MTGQDRATDCGDYGSTTDVHFRRLTKGTLLLEEEQLRLLPKFLSHDGRPQASVYTRRLSGRLMRACVCGSFHSRGEVEHSVKRQKVALKEKSLFPLGPRVLCKQAQVSFSSSRNGWRSRRRACFCRFLVRDDLTRPLALAGALPHSRPPARLVGDGWLFSEPTTAAAGVSVSSSRSPVGSPPLP